MTRAYKTGLLITVDATGDMRAVQVTAKEIDKLGTAGKKVGEKLKSFGDYLKNVGRTKSSRVMAPITAAGVGILKTAGDFEAAMNRVAAVSFSPFLRCVVLVLEPNLGVSLYQRVA